MVGHPEIASQSLGLDEKGRTQMNCDVSGGSPAPVKVLFEDLFDPESNVGGNPNNASQN